jgi:hypothetical protein
MCLSAFPCTLTSCSKSRMQPLCAAATTSFCPRHPHTLNVADCLLRQLMSNGNMSMFQMGHLCPVTESFIGSITIEIVLLRTRSKEKTFCENPFYSRRERVLCKIYKCDSGRPATSRAAPQILSAVENMR